MKLIENWAIHLKNRLSIRLAAAFAAACAAVTAYPGILVGLLAYFPDGWRAFAAGGVFVILFAVPTLVSLIKQPKLEAKLKEAQDVADS